MIMRNLAEGVMVLGLSNVLEGLGGFGNSAYFPRRRGVGTISQIEKLLQKAEMVIKVSRRLSPTFIQNRLRA